MMFYDGWFISESFGILQESQTAKPIDLSYDYHVV